MTGVMSDTHVIAVTIDITASAIGTGKIMMGQACVVAGIWRMNQVIVECPFDHSNIFLNSIFADPSLYLILEGSRASTRLENYEV